MLYKICNNGRAVLVTREPIMIGDALKLQFDKIEDGYTAIFTTGGRNYYRGITNGECLLEKEKISAGVIYLIVVKNDETRPTYICDQLYATVGKDDVCVCGNILEYDTLLRDLRVENNELREDMALFKSQLLQFREEFDEIMKGYNVL